MMKSVTTSTNKALRPYWQLASLWGVDAALAAVCWSIFLGVGFQVPILTPWPVVGVFAAVWLVLLGVRLIKALAGGDIWNADYYRSHLAAMIVIMLAVILAISWILLCVAGRLILDFATVPFLMFILAFLPLLSRSPQYRAMCLSGALVFTCAIPSHYFAFFVSPLQMLLNTPLWLLIIVFFMFTSLRRQGEDSAERGTVAYSACLMVFFLFSVWRLSESPEFLHSIYLAIAVSIVCLHILARLRKYMSADAWYAIGWPFMAIPPLLGIFTFAPN